MAMQGENTSASCKGLRTAAWCAFCLIWALGLSIANAQDLDALERRLEAEKQAEAQRQEAARRASAAAAAERARMAVLVIRSDAPCRLHLDGQHKADLERDVALTIDVLGGQQLIECESTEESTARVSHIKELAAGSKEVVLLELAAQLSTIRNKREREAELHQLATDKAKVERESQKALSGGFVEQRSALLLDTLTGLVWTQSDNGYDIGWKKAMEFCAAKNMRLPTMDELRAIVDRPGVGVNKCSEWSVCAVTPLLHLTSPWFWSSTTQGRSNAWNVSLQGHQDVDKMSRTSNLRVLCVR